MKNDRLSNFNPLRGLTLERCVEYFEAGERGYYADLMWLYRAVLRRNGVARAVRRKLTAAIGRLDWNIKIPDDLSDELKPIAERQQARLRAAYDAIGNLNEAIVHLAFADIMGFSHVLKVYAGTGAEDPWQVVELRPVEQWFMCRKGLFGAWHYNPEAAPVNSGRRIVERDWIWREVDDPAAEIFTISHVKMSTTDADWDQFCDTYAVPPLFVEGPPNVRREDEPRYQQTAEEVVSDSRGYLPNGSKVHTVTPGTGGESVFTERLRYYREEIVLAGTGGILTTLSGEGAFGQGGAADEHGDTWLDIAAAVGSAVSTCLQRGFDRPTLERLFPGEPVLAYFALDKPEHDRDATDVLSDAKLAREAGYRIGAEELSEKTGYQLEPDTSEARAAANAPADPAATQPAIFPAGNGITPREAAPGNAAVSSPNPQPGAGEGTPPERPAPGGTPGEESPRASAAGEAKPSLVQAALANDLEVEERWLAPVADVLNEIEAMLLDEATPLEEVAAKIEEAARSMPELLGKLNTEELARALEKAAGPAALEGLADGLRAKSRKPTV